MNEQQDETPRANENHLDEEHVSYERRRARDAVERLTSEGELGDITHLYFGIEGGEISERVLSLIFEDLKVPDPRTTDPLDSAAQELQETVYEVGLAPGVHLRLTRTPIDDGEDLVELEAAKLRDARSDSSAHDS